MKRSGIWATLAGLIGCMLLMMFWITLIAIRTDRESRMMERNAEQDRTISIALWRADSFLAPLVSKYAAMPVEAFSHEQNVFLPQLAPVADDAFVRSRFHLPKARDSDAAGDLLATTPIPSQNADAFPPPAPEWAAVSTSDWPRLYEQLPKENQPSLSELVALNRRDNAFNGGLRQNAYYAGNRSKAPNSENDLQTRNFALQYAQANTNQVQQITSNVQENVKDTPLQKPRTGLVSDFVIGISKPIWDRERLLIARTIRSSHEVAIQGVELNWPTIREELANQVRDLVADAVFQPTLDAQSEKHLLAALPVRMDVPPPSDEGFRWSPLMIAVVGGWVVMFAMSGGLAAICLSSLRFADKRSSFVNSVTHELRTPLTTFKMYSDLLSRDMVAEDSKQAYLQTLCSESNRLCHLIDNVLTYARLENGGESRRKEMHRVEPMVHRLVPRLIERAALDAMRLDVQMDANLTQEILSVDMSSLEQILFNLVDNASKYACQSDPKSIQLLVTKQANAIAFRVTDGGPGISRAQRAILFKPFSKSSEQAANSKPGVGLGLCRSARLAKQMNGHLKHIPTTAGCAMELTLPMDPEAAPSIGAAL